MITYPEARRPTTYHRRPIPEVSGFAAKLLAIQVRSPNCTFKEKSIIFTIFYSPEPSKRHGDPERDPGTKSEGEEELQQGATSVPCKKSLGKTPNHLTLR